MTWMLSGQEMPKGYAEGPHIIDHVALANLLALDIACAPHQAHLEVQRQVSSRRTETGPSKPCSDSRVQMSCILTDPCFPHPQDEEGDC